MENIRATLSMHTEDRISDKARTPRCNKVFMRGTIKSYFDDFVCKGAWAGWGAKIQSWDDGGRFLWWWWCGACGGQSPLSEVHPAGDRIFVQRKFSPQQPSSSYCTISATSPTIPTPQTTKKAKITRTRTRTTTTTFTLSTTTATTYNNN